MKGNYANLELGKKDRASEYKGIQGSNDEFYVFHHLNDVAFDEQGNLLGTAEAERLKRIGLKLRGAYEQEKAEEIKTS